MSTWFKELAELDATDCASASRHERWLGTSVKSPRSKHATLGNTLRRPPRDHRYQDETAFRRELADGKAGLGSSALADKRAPNEPPLTEFSPLAQSQLPPVLGRGAMRGVYKLSRTARTALDAIVAAEVLGSDAIKDKQERAWFGRHVKATARATRPPIVQATEPGRFAESYFPRTGYVNVPGLIHLRSKVGRMPAAGACELVRPAARGWRHARSSGMGQRDLSAANLTLARSADGPAQVARLGWGRTLLGAHPQGSGGRELTTDGQVMGAFAYLAPEQAWDTDEVHIRTDIYSFGATLYRPCRSQMPLADLQGQSPIQSLKAIVHVSFWAHGATALCEGGFAYTAGVAVSIGLALTSSASKLVVSTDLT